MVWAHSGPGFDALRAHIDKAYMAGNYKEQWRNLPEIPMTSEIWSATDESSNVRPMQERWNEYQMEAPYSKSLPHNNIKGPWESKAAYLGAHYQILREDEIAPLRKSVADVKARPDMMDDNETHVYTHVSLKPHRSMCWSSAHSSSGNLQRNSVQSSRPSISYRILYRKSRSADPMGTIEEADTGKHRCHISPQRCFPYYMQSRCSCCSAPSRRSRPKPTADRYILG